MASGEDLGGWFLLFYLLVIRLFPTVSKPLTISIRFRLILPPETAILNASVSMPLANPRSIGSTVRPSRPITA